MSNEYYNLLNNKIIIKKFQQFDSNINDLHNQILDISGNGPTGPTGANGITSGLILFLDSDGGSIETNGSLSSTPNTNFQTALTFNINIPGTYQIGKFTTSSIQNIELLGGIWTANIYASANVNDVVKYYFKLFYVDSSSNEILIVNNSSIPSPIQSTLDVYSNSSYIADRILPDLSCNYRIYLYAVSTGSVILNVYFRSNTISHVHTTLGANLVPGPTGYTGIMGPTGKNASTTGPTGIVQLSDGLGNFLWKYWISIHY